MSRRALELVHGGARYVVVPRSQVQERPSDLAARWLVEDALREGGMAVAVELERLAERLVGRMVIGTREAAEIVVTALMEGRLVAVAVAEPTRTLAAVEVVDLRTLGGWEVEEPLLEPSVDGTEPRPLAEHWIEVRVLDPRGRPLPKWTVRVELPSGRLLGRVTEAAGVIHVEEIEEDGLCSLELYTVAEPRR